MFENLKYNLRNNRRHVVKSAVSWFLFGAIILVFVFWGMNPRDQGVDTGGAAAVVNNASISLAQFSEAVERLRRNPRFEQFQAMGGDAGRQMLNQQALNELVDLELINQAASQQHILASDAEIRDFLVEIPEFQEDGHFRSERYRRYVEQIRKTPAQFEADIRREQAMRRMFRMFSASLAPLKVESEKTAALKEMKANLEFVAVPIESLIVSESVSNADVKAYSADAGNDSKIKDYFTSHQQEFNSPEKVKARHILIRAQAGDAEAEKKALAKIEDLASRAKAKPEDFGKLASQFSEDPGSKSRGGLLDFFSRGRMVPEFEQAAFSLAANEVSAPVKTEYGYHLIQVLEKKAAQNRTVKDAKDEVAGILIAKDRSRAAVETLQSALKKSELAVVQKFVTDHKLKWEETGSFSIDSDVVPKIGPNDELVRVAFQLTAAKPLSESLVREGGKAFVVRHKPVPAVKDAPKNKQADMMNEMMAGRRTEESVRKWIEELRKSAKISTNPKIYGREG
jgi:peptidyl-prolyl cis-trans isomerase D